MTLAPTWTDVAEAEVAGEPDAWLVSTIRCVAHLVAQGADDALLLRAWRAYESVGHVRGGGGSEAPSSPCGSAGHPSPDVLAEER